jgi:hypothetical protein
MPAPTPSRTDRPGVLPLPIISESVVFDEDVVVPSDGDARTIGSLLPALEVLTDRTRYLKSEIDSGAKFVRRVASLSLLKAETGMVDGEVRSVDRHGLYQYFAAATDPSLEPAVAVPNSTVGRWVHSQIAMAVANGFSSLDTDGKVKKAQLRGFLSHGFDCIATGVPSIPTTYTVTATNVGAADTLITAPVVVNADGVGLDFGDHLIVSSDVTAKLGTAADVFFFVNIDTTFDTISVGGLTGEFSSAEFRSAQSFRDSGKLLINGDAVVQARLMAYAATPGTVIVKNPLSFGAHIIKFRG